MVTGSTTSVTVNSWDGSGRPGRKAVGTLIPLTAGILAIGTPAGIGAQGSQ